jgi:hypothetical protein
VEFLTVLHLINSKALRELATTKLATTKFIAETVEIFGNRISYAVDSLEKLYNNELNNFYSSSNIIRVLNQ